MGWESFDLIKFDLGPILQGQTKIAKLKSRLPRVAIFAFEYSLSIILKRVLFLAINATKSAIFPLKINKNLLSLCHFYYLPPGGREIIKRIPCVCY